MCKENKNDILQELTEEELKKLCDIYRKYRVKFPTIYGFLVNVLKAISLNLKFIFVYSLKESWKLDGTFIAIIPFHGYDIVMHSLDPEGKNLKEALTKTKRLDFSSSKSDSRNAVLFYALHEQFRNLVLNFIKEKLKGAIYDDTATNLYYLSREKAKKIQLEKIPKDIYIKQLEIEDLATITELWPNNYPGATQKFEDYLKLQKGFGIFLRSNNELVSWVVPSILAGMTALQTKTEHQRKGYAKLIIQKMSQYLAEDEQDYLDNFGTVSVGNDASAKLMEKLGFSLLNKCHYIQIIRITSSSSQQ